MPKLADRYPFPAAEGSNWKVPQDFDVTFNWDYDEGRQTMMGLYRKGVEMQWNAETRIDWSQELDEDNPEQLPEEMLPISGMAEYEAMSRKEKAQVRRHFQGWQISQFMQGEQGALICAAKIVTQVPDVDSKFYASTQVIDEARHVESYKRLLEKFGVAYPMTPPLQELIDQVLRDSRWDMTYLGMQVVIEGLALAAFQQIRDHAQNPLAAAVNAYVMQDEARHVAFGRLALRDYYPQLSDAERAEREEFTVQACWHMRDRFNQREVFERLGLPVKECVEILDHSESMQMFRSRIFSRIVPTVRDIGLWGPKVQEAFAAMGAIEFAKADAAAMLENDARVADEFDARARLRDAGVSAAAE